MAGFRSNSSDPEAAARGPNVAYTVREASGCGRNTQGCAAGSYCKFKPRSVLGELEAFQRAGSQGAHDVRADDGRLMDLHWDPGDRAGHL